MIIHIWLNIWGRGVNSFWRLLTLSDTLPQLSVYRHINLLSNTQFAGILFQMGRVFTTKSTKINGTVKNTARKCTHLRECWLPHIRMPADTCSPPTQSRHTVCARDTELVPRPLNMVFWISCSVMCPSVLISAGMLLLRLVRAAHAHAILLPCAILLLLTVPPPPQYPPVDSVSSIAVG